MNFTINNTATTLVSGLMTVRTWCEKVVKEANKNVWSTGSTPNKLLMLGMNSIAAYAVGVNPAYIGMMVLVTTLFCLKTTPRWMLETAVIANLVLIAASTLPESSVTAFEYLVLIKFIFEFYCSLFDKFIQAYATWAADQKHSYYFFGVVAMSILLTTLQSSPYIQGFIEGLIQGLAGN